ncbi:hypothetical protein OF83DRAFT_9152 [Amylostereum chailletii]|nr:hypothetical protein OF83DRAFT_9152 [Amylostereum chailletii]
MADVHAPQQQHVEVEHDGFSDATSDQRDDDQKKSDDELADRLSSIIEDANSRLLPLTKMIRSHIENMESRPEEERNESELVKAVRPLIEQADKILNEANGAVKGADPDNRVSNRAKRHAEVMASAPVIIVLHGAHRYYQAHAATASEQRLAAALKVLIQEVGGTIEWAKNKLDAFPKAKRDLGPLLDALGQPLTQIVGGVGLLLTGVLNLVGKLLSGLGLDSLLKGIVTATGLDKIYAGLGLGKLMS